MIIILLYIIIGNENIFGICKVLKSNSISTKKQTFLDYMPGIAKVRPLELSEKT